jgi:hypothetical protein
MMGTICFLRSWHFMVAALLACSSLLPHHAVAIDPPTTAEPLVLELTLSYGSAELHQEIVVTEESDFRVITHAEHLRWNIEGHIGRIADGVAPVDLAYGAYYSSAENTSAASPVKLRVDEYTGSGWGDGRLMIGGLWLRRGLDLVSVTSFVSP